VDKNLISEIVKDIPNRPARTTQSKKEIETAKWEAIIDSSLHLIYIDINDLKSFFACRTGNCKGSIESAITNYLHFNYKHINEWPEYVYKFNRNDNGDIQSIITIFKPFGDKEKDILFMLQME